MNSIQKIFGKSLLFASSLLLSSQIVMAEEVAPNYQLNTSFQSQEDLQKQVNFLLGDELLVEGDGNFHNGTGKTPKSYASNNVDYWGGYLCGSVDCQVTNDVFLNPFSVSAVDPNSDGAKLQIDRALLTHSAVIYDASTWQIALALASRMGFSNLSPAQAETLILNQMERLRKTTSKASSDFSYGYGEVTIPNHQYAYNLRMLGPGYTITDPLKDSPYANFVTSTQDVLDIGINNNQDWDKVVTWPDWKPITGENGWANLVAPAQSALLLYGSAEAIPFNSVFLQHSLEFLWALQQNQSARGSFFYILNGATGNDGGAVQAGTISNENNFSALAGMKMLQQILLRIHHNSDQVLTDMETAQLNTAVNVIDIMLYGGETPQGTTDGLLNFLKDFGKDPNSDSFLQGGNVDAAGVFHLPVGLPYAVDVNTWGVATLGAQTVDDWYGAGSAYRMWIDVRTIGGYFNPSDPNELWGVGYSTQNDGSDRVFSGEWTNGALNMVQMLTKYYQKAGGLTSVEMDLLAADEANMIANLPRLRHDNYAAGEWQNLEGGVEPMYHSTLPDDQQAFLYASRRYAIPFGWYANPIPSLASSTWSLYNAYDFNPFGMFGSQESLFYDLNNPPAYDSSNWHLAYDPSEVTILNTGFDAAFDPVELKVDYIMADGSFQSATDRNGVAFDENNPIPTNGYGRIVLSDDVDQINLFLSNPDAGDTSFIFTCFVRIGTDVSRDELKRNPTGTSINAIWGQDACGISFDADPTIYTVTAADLAVRAATCDELGIIDPANGCDDPNTTDDLIAPSDPSGLTLVDSDNSSLTLSWTAATDNVGVTGYQVIVDGGTPINVGQVTTTQLTLSSGTYDVVVLAYDAAGNISANDSASTNKGTFTVPSGGNPVDQFTISQEGNGDVTYSVTVDGQRTTAFLFAKVNEIHIFASSSMNENNHGDGTYTYSITDSASNYSVNDVVEGRVYLHSVPTGQTFLPGPGVQSWASLIYGGGPTDEEPPIDPSNSYIVKNADGSVTFSVTFATQQQQVQVFARKNGEGGNYYVRDLKTFEGVLVNGATEVQNGDGSYTYSITHQDAVYTTVSTIITRFYSYVTGVQSFIPGPSSAEWSEAFNY